MARVVLERAVLFAIPFLVWFAWALWARRSGRVMGSTPWPWLFAAGAFLMGVSLMAGAIFHRDNRYEAYVPAETAPSGHVIPGRFEKRAPPPK